VPHGFVTPLIGAAHRMAIQCNNLIAVQQTLDRVTTDPDGKETREVLRDDRKTDAESTVPY